MTLEWNDEQHVARPIWFVPVRWLFWGFLFGALLGALGVGR